MRAYGMRSVVACGLALAALGAPARGQVSSSDQRCITSFNRGIRQIAKAEGKIVNKCLQNFASGQLVTTTAEGCLLLDPSGRRTRSTEQAMTATSLGCGTGPLPFGVTSALSATVSAAVNQVDLVHGVIGPDLDTSLIPSNVGSRCQAGIVAAMVRCQDTRVREFLKCQKTGLRNGTILNGTGLAATCLGSGDAAQPDGTGRIAKACVDRVGTVVLSRCTTTDLAAAFPACGATTPGGLLDCLTAGSGCRFCQLVNDVDGLARDCDRFDDGDGSNGSCGAECADGVLQAAEACDDGGTTPGDGCTASCTVEAGWACSGSPSVCTPTCGNGTFDEGENCDDGNDANGDGCASACVVESGYTCTGSPSVCTRNCGDGAVSAADGEACDDGDATDGDGCSTACEVEPGYVCSGQPSVCTFACGNGTFQGAETCDDADTTGGDGCSAVCQIESGWLCTGQPSLCVPICGDRLIRPGETCDDGNATSNDGCSLGCQVEAGFTCNGQPSNCIPICGDGFIRGAETCDDGDNTGGDGCSGTFCLQEVGYTCSGQPSVCIFNCGNGDLDPQEECDDGDLANGDGCDNRCRGETGWACGGEPSICVPTCGNGALSALETCDDGNISGGDGCSASCRNESGWLCNSPGTPCTPFGIFVDSPAHGAFTTAGSIVVSGHYTQLPPGTVSVAINGVPASSVNQLTRTFSHTVPLSQVVIFNGVRATLTNLANGDDVHDRIVVIAGQSVADGAISPQSVAMRVNDSGLDTIEPLVAELAGGGLNIATLIPAGTVLADECFINAIGCWGSARVKIGNPPPSYGSLNFTADSKTNAVGANINIRNFRLDVDIDGSGLVPDCGLRISAYSMDISGDYGLEPNSSNPSYVDVNLVSPVGASFGGFNYSFTYGICGAPIIGDIIQLFLPDIQAFAVDGIKGFLADPDGGGPQDSPIADAIETSLSEISISGAVGTGVGLQFDAPLFQVAEDNAGLTLGAGARFTVGSGAGMCVPPPGAPNLTASYSKADAFPSYGATTSVAHAPYGIGIGISPAGFNQLLKGQTECGLMRSSLTTIDLDGPGGSPSLAITSSLLSLLVPEFGQLPANTPLRIDIAPTLAPVITGNAGPNGELSELRIAHVAVDIVQPGPETVWLSGAFDASLGMNLTFNGSGLGVTIAAPGETATLMTVIYNPLGADEAQIETVLPSVMRPLIPSLAGALSGFPLPQFFGLNLSGVEVSRNGAFLSLFANLTPGP